MFLLWLPWSLHATKGEVVPAVIQSELNGKNVAEQITVLLQKAEQLQFKDAQTAFQCASVALSLSQKNNIEVSEAISRFWVSDIEFNQSIYGSNLEVIYARTDIADSIFQKHNLPEWEIRCLQLKAEISKAIKIISVFGDKNSAQMNRAKSEINKALTLFDSIQPADESLGGYLLNVKASIIYDDNKAMIDSSMIWWKQAIKIFKGENEPLGLARVYLNMAMFSKSDNETYFEKAIKYNQQIKNKEAQKRVYLRYGTFCIDSFEVSKKEVWWQKGISNLQKGLHLTGEQNTCDALNRLGHAYAVAGVLDTAGSYFTDAIYQSKKELNTRCLSNFIDARKAVCAKLNNCDTLSEELINAYTYIMSKRDNVIFDAAQEKESYRQVMKAQAEAQRRNRMRLFYAGLLSLLGIIFYIVFQRQQIQKLESKTKAQEARIQALGARMNPHFISNTLNAIDSMIFTNDKVEASNYLVKFSKLSRLVLANSEFTLIPLNKEIEMLNYYLSLEKLRFGEEVDFDFKVADDLDLENINIPPMLLQPFVENSILHGIKPKNGKGKIKIHLSTNSENELNCIIEDDGIGRPKEKVVVDDERRSFSTQITEDRIDLLNKLEGASFEIDDLEEEGIAAGTRVMITLPKNLKA